MLKLPTKQAVLETLKEAFRIAFFAALTALAAWATNKLAGFDPTSIYYIGGTILLRLLDKYIHENENIKSNGISPL